MAPKPTTEQTACTVPAALTAELAAANFVDYTAALVAINEIRTRYMSRIQGDGIGDVLHANLARDINLQCDRVLARLVPIQDASTRSLA